MFWKSCGETRLICMRRASPISSTRAMQRLANCGEKLTGILNDEQRKLFEEYVDDQREVSVIVDCESFINGFKLGAKIMLDVLTEEEMKEL